MRVSRRSVLKAGLGAGALVAAGPLQALAEPLGPGEEFGTSRVSRLRRGGHLVHADLHNHSQQSDGAGDPRFAYESMRAAGLDVAALTDHTTLSAAYGGACAAFPPPSPGERDDCRSLFGMNEEHWQATAALADDADATGDFAALRGFEWSSPYLGHMNVWFTRRWTDPLQTGGFTAGGLAALGLTEPALRVAVAPFGELGERLLADILASVPTSPSAMTGFYSWLDRAPGTPVVEGGADGIAGFNHPNREVFAFDAFAYDARLRERIVSMEIMNRREDYLFKNFDEGLPSPLNACLNAGWSVGLLGVTDEHATDWGFPDGKGRAGLYVRQLSRAGVREALSARRFFATNLRGLRLDATAKGVPMGGQVPHRRGPVRFRVDLDRGPGAAGTPLEIQVLVPGDDVPEVAHVEPVTLRGDGAITSFAVSLDADEVPWVVLRIADQAGVNDNQGPAGHPANNLAVAYSSPFFLTTGGRRPTAVVRGAGRRAPTAAPPRGGLAGALTHP